MIFTERIEVWRSDKQHESARSLQPQQTHIRVSWFAFSTHNTGQVCERSHCCTQAHLHVKETNHGNWVPGTLWSPSILPLLLLFAPFQTATRVLCRLLITKRHFQALTFLFIAQVSFAEWIFYQRTENTVTTYQESESFIAVQVLDTEVPTGVFSDTFVVFQLLSWRAARGGQWPPQLPNPTPTQPTDNSVQCQQLNILLTVFICQEAAGWSAAAD